jgi:hypothetical protein
MHVSPVRIGATFAALVVPLAIFVEVTSRPSVEPVSTESILRTYVPPLIVPAPTAPEVPDFGSCREASLDEAMRAIERNDVDLVVQPHEGMVGMLLRSGATLRFSQPHLDWVMLYARRQGIDERIQFVIE